MTQEEIVHVPAVVNNHRHHHVEQKVSVETNLLQRLARTCHKSIQISSGVQGLADAFMMMRLLFESETAQRLNLDIFETIYFAACEASCELAA